MKTLKCKHIVYFFKGNLRLEGTTLLGFLIIFHTDSKI